MVSDMRRAAASWVITHVCRGGQSLALESQTEACANQPGSFSSFNLPRRVLPGGINYSDVDSIGF